MNYNMMMMLIRCIKNGHNDVDIARTCGVQIDTVRAIRITIGDR